MAIIHRLYLDCLNYKLIFITKEQIILRDIFLHPFIFFLKDIYNLALPNTNLDSHFLIKYSYFAFNFIF